VIHPTTAMRYTIAIATIPLTMSCLPEEVGREPGSALRRL
jgi:hypothetical protein